MAKPNYTGVYHMVSQDNFEAYLAALDVNYALRKVVCLLKPSKQIEHDVNTGNMKIKTVTTFKNFDMDFTLGEEFTEDLGPVDGRMCQLHKRLGAVPMDNVLRMFQTTVDWEGDKLLCVQRGEKEERGWTHWLEGNTLHLELRAEGVTAKQVFKKAE
ncbi:retinol-binding protein 5 isoform X1 [Triplophysa rosa]|uniref:retinol-binding protein 5 isoform X1 n=1 Tax=Triplophysa rosa TaxID=992332 RepID=UPI00254634F1|nr:retinol-binding protein 5 isoform X1 [Triplophysa rosa]